MKTDPRETLLAIHALMDAKEWSADTLQDIAAALARSGLRVREPGHAEEDARYACPECGAVDVELCFPVWVKANDIDNRELWDLDAEAAPEKDSDKGYCPRCETNVLVRKEVNHGP